jgi:uncharacterized protein (DUF58 family)
MAAKRQAWLQDPELFMAMEDLELVARGVVEGALHGLHRSPYLGFSVEFDAHREYQPGDDLRYVNWNLWGRTDRLYVKQFKSDTNLNLYLLLDTSASMLCRHGPSEKWKYGARALAALAFLALNSRDAAGLYLLHDRVREYVPPYVRPGQLHEILSLLQNAEPAGTTDLGRALDETMHLCRRRGLVLLVSDLFDRDQAIRDALSSLRYAGHEVILFHLLDPWEQELPETGQYEFRDLETGAKVQTNAASLRESYNRAVSSWRSRLKRHCDDTGIDWVPCLTSDPLRDVLINYLLKRARLF